MKRYLLLRDNKETGPYSLEELKALSLKSSDLIWTEGSSTAWKYPLEIEELKQYVQQEPEKHLRTTNHHKNNVKTKSVFVSLPLSFEPKRKDDLSVKDEPQLETRYCRSLDELKETYAQRLQQRKKTFHKKNTNISDTYWIAALFFGVIGCAFIVKQIVDGFDQNLLQANVATATAIPVEPDTNTATTETTPEIPLADYRNALVTEEVQQLNEAPPVAKNAVAKTIKPENLNKEVSIKSNDYHVGLLGGVRDLKLSIYNNSNYPLDQVRIKVSYLKPNGQTLKEDMVEIKSVPAKGTKTISVPSSKRGVKVKYQIVRIHSDSYSKLLET